MTADSETLKLGDTLTIGRLGEEEDLVWRVRAVEENWALLICECCVDSRQFNHSRDQGNSWETSDLRTWLNGPFLANAFTDEERARICGEVFCPGIEDAEELFADDKDRICFPASHARAHGARTDYLGACAWWLRSAGEDSMAAAYVFPDGGLFPKGIVVTTGYLGVRPAFWVAL